MSITGRKEFTCLAGELLYYILKSSGQYQIHALRTRLMHMVIIPLNTNHSCLHYHSAVLFHAG